MSPISFAYYCSGHGYGHATRVSAFATHLLSLTPLERPTIYIVSSAPKHVFSDSLERGARYRFAEIDPVIVQPLAYHVDRQKSLDVLRAFLAMKDCKVEEEVAWLKDAAIDCVLTDAAFLACLAANVAGIPCALITNFTFDSVYSYLCTKLIDSSSPIIPSFGQDLQNDHPVNEVLDDEPLAPEVVTPLVDQMLYGYRCADLLLRLPGHIPIPSFAQQPSLPSYEWIDHIQNSIYPEVRSHLCLNVSDPLLWPSIPFSRSTKHDSKPKRPRKIIQAPLIVRAPSSDIYTAQGRERLLHSIGVPDHMHHPEIKILIVSFGGQIFRKPRSGSRTPSRATSPTGQMSPLDDLSHSPSQSNFVKQNDSPKVQIDGVAHSQNPATANSSHFHIAIPPRIATPSHLWIPGAPPANKPPTPTLVSEALLAAPAGILTITPPTPLVDVETSIFGTAQSEIVPQLLPDASWIAVVCGVPTQWGRDDGEELPEGFFIAPRDVYMPDLTAIADVLLGKLGYGTVSECVDACTPFVYVPRPLFIEEHGLRLLLESEGVGVELSRRAYEAGDWASSVEEAWLQGRDAKERKRKEGLKINTSEGGRALARELVRWVHEWNSEAGPRVVEGAL